MLAKLPRDVTGNLNWITVGMRYFIKLKQELACICINVVPNWSVAFLAEPSISLEREIDWKIVVFTPENVEKGSNTIAQSVLDFF